MKTSNFFKTIAIAALSGFLGVNTFAQSAGMASLPALKTLPADSTSQADTVSSGAKMQYLVIPDPAIKASSLYNGSGFSWTISSGTLTKLNGTALTPSPVASGYYTDTTVYATMPTTTTAQDITLSVGERSNPKFSATSGCPGNTRNLAINVIKLPGFPTIADADTAQGGCTASANYTVNFNFSGLTAKYPMYVSCSIKAYDISNNPTGTPSTLYFKINNASGKIVLSKQYDLDVVSASGARYVITLDKVWDRISANALNRDDLGVSSATTPVKAAIYILPTPKTGVIKHIKTL